MTTGAQNQPGRRLAVVSGAASGIGLATATALTADGIPVVGVDIAEAPAGLDAAGWIAGDVVDSGTWSQVEQTCRTLDPLGADCFVACAGTVDPGPLLDTPIESWRRHFDINVLGVVQGLQALMPAMREQRSGWVAIVSSVSGLIVEDGASAYGASKAALLQVARSAALEYASEGIRVNAVCPGIVDTPLLRRFIDAVDDPPALVREMENRTPTGELIDSAEVASVLRFLVSDGASALSGATITIDGGLTTTYDFDVSARG